MNCQLYTYNEDELSIEKFQDAEVLEKYILSEQSEKKFHWLNFHSLANKEAISALFDSHGFHKLTLEDVYTEKHRPKLEEFGDYIFFSIQSALPIQENATKLNQE